MYALAALGLLFWLIQLAAVMMLSDDYFESHSHRLLWFLVVLLGNVVGAVWFSLWKANTSLEVVRRSQQRRIESLAAAERDTFRSRSSA